MDPATIAATISAGAAALKAVKEVADKWKTSGKPEAAADLINVQLAMMDLLQKQQDLIEDNRQLRDKIATLEGTIKLKGELLYRYDAYWRRLEDGSLDGPFFPAPWEHEGKLIRLRCGKPGIIDGVERMAYRDARGEYGASAPMTFLRENRATVLADLAGTKGA